jgi:SAM-dependent methyltransferase
MAAGRIPVLIDEDHSVFSIDTFVRQQPTFFRESGPVATLLKRFVPQLGANRRSKPNYTSLRDRLLTASRRPRVLVLGGSILGHGMEPLDVSDIELVETDVALGSRTKIICDAHSIPFADASFDAVVAQAVLEHVIDPFRCVAEIHRVLKSDGFVYAETPFMQQVHGGAYDFLRFSHLAYLRLFRHFERIDSGAVAGPGTALAWSYEFFLLSFVRSRMMRNIVKAFARTTAFALKYFDALVIDRPAALDAASGFYFLGRRSESELSDRELLTMYRGGA